jgi:RNA polymerase sigma-70 factor (ECF subfamily)
VTARELLFCEVRLSDSPAIKEQAALLESIRPRLLYFALNRLRDRTSAEEVVQETLAVVLQALRDNRVEDPARLPGYVFGVARNLVFRVLRERAREADPGPDGQAAEAGPWLEDVEGAFLLEEQRQQVREALSRISADDRNILERTFTADDSLEEIAAAMGIPYAAVRKRKSRALQRLKKIFLERSQKK